MDHEEFARLYEEQRYAAASIAAKCARDGCRYAKKASQLDGPGVRSLDAEDGVQDATIEFLDGLTQSGIPVTPALFIRKTCDRTKDIVRGQRRRWHRQQPVGLPHEGAGDGDARGTQHEPTSPRDAALDASVIPSSTPSWEDSGTEQHEPGVEDIPRIAATIRWAEATAARDLARLVALGPMKPRWVVQVFPKGTPERRAWLKSERERKVKEKATGLRTIGGGVKKRPFSGRDWLYVSLSDQVDAAGYALDDLRAVLDRLHDEAATAKAVRRHLKKKSGENCRVHNRLQDRDKVGGIRVKGGAAAAAQWLSQLPARRPRPLSYCPACVNFGLTFGRAHAHARACPLEGHPVPMIHVIQQRGLIPPGSPVRLGFGIKPEHTPSVAPGRAPRRRLIHGALRAAFLVRLRHASSAYEARHAREPAPAELPASA